jgi:stress response protein YsnF
MLQSTGLGMSMFDMMFTLQKSYLDQSLEVMARVPETINRIVKPLRDSQVAVVDQQLRFVERQISAINSGKTMWSDTVPARKNRVGVADLHNSEEVIPLSTQTLQVGKRLVEGAKTRVVRRPIAMPIQQDVSLMSQVVVVERRPVAGGRRIDDADALNARTVEMADIYEVPVITKGLEVFEEVVLRRETTTRIETIHDHVERDSVEIEQARQLVRSNAEPQPMRQASTNGKDRDFDQNNQNNEERPIN